MFRKIKILSGVLVSCCILTGRISAQDYNLEESLTGFLRNGYPATFLQKYMEPFTTALGTSINGSSFHSAKVIFFPHLEISANAVYLSVPEEARYFNYEGRKYPTFFGPYTPGLNDSIEGSGLTGYMLPLLQLDLGMFSSFQASVRGSRYRIPEMGQINLFGLGVKYGLSDLITLETLHMDLSVQAFYHAYSIGDWLSSGSFAINVQNSTRLSAIPLEIFAGLGYERVSLKIKTENLSGVGGDAIGDILIDGENGVRLTLGMGMSVLVFNFHAEYDFGVYDSAGGGVSLRF
jgi:hypothetical protein